jgi:glycosyltransferase involved in cell wall biosynthesis
MRVVIVLNTAWNIYNFRMGLMRALKENGIEVIAVAPKDGYEEQIEQAGFQFEHVAMDSTGANPVKDILLMHNLYKVYKKIKPDLVLHFTIKPNTYGTIAANWLKIPVINNVCGLGTVFLDKNLVSSIAIWMYRYTFRFPKLVFFQNEQDRSLFLERSLVRKEITDVIPGSGINLAKFKPEERRIQNNKFTFLVISRLLHDKGIVEYIEAAKKLKEDGLDARFQLLGPKDPVHKRGIPEELVDSWIENNFVEYLGTTDDVRRFIHSADCVVLPSYREGTPRTLLEAASLAKPIVTTDVPGCNNVVEDQYNGYLCKLKDHNDLATKMKDMALLDGEILEKMGQNSRKKAEKEFDERIVIDRYIDYIKKFIKLN